jgi:DNA-binding winged helix-turn-helix (wHTH) protein
MPSFKFAEFTLIASQRRLFREEKEVGLRDRDFDVLLTLLENRARILSKDAIIKAVWNGLTVEDNSVERAVVNIRKTLGDSAAKPRFIKTVRGKGYLFVADVKESDPPGGALSGDVFLQIAAPPSSRRTSKWAAPVLLALLLIALCSLGWSKRADLYERLTARMIFRDDFSGPQIDSRKWTVTGREIRLSDGTARITVDEVDHGGVLQSTDFTIDPDKPLTIKSRVKVSYNQSVRANVNFVGGFGLVGAGDEAAGADKDFFGVKYANADGEFCSPGNIVRAEGFYLVKENGDVRENRDHNEGRIGPQIESVWANWFEQKLVYEPRNETLLYFIDGEKKGEFVIGRLPLGKENKLRLKIYPQGWWLHHALEIDDIELTQ